MIGDYCRKYRLCKNVTLKQLGGEDQVKNLSAFEHGRSTNINHLLKYINLSKEYNELELFMCGLQELLENE